MINYLIELTIIHSLLIGGYWLFLKQENQYGQLRMYLLGSTLLALIIPVLDLSSLLTLFQNNPTEKAPEGFTLMLMPMTFYAETGVESNIFNLTALFWLYGMVTCWLLYKVLSGISYLMRLEREAEYVNIENVYIRLVPNLTGSFTFFSRIFVNKNMDRNAEEFLPIIRHEHAHARLGHSYDRLFLEVFIALFWYLPGAWFAIKEIKKIHEYQADAYALKSCTTDRYSSILISSVLRSNGLSVASSFHDGLILKRLKAMKQNVKQIKPWKFQVLGIWCGLLVIALACSEEPDQETKAIGGPGDAGQSKMEDDVFTKVEEQPQYPGGTDALYEYVMREIKYPKDARIRGIEGRVHVQFVVEKDGSLSDVKAVKGIGAGCDDEAVRVLQNAASFSPGRQRGKPVRVRMVMPIIFKLNEGKTNEDNSSQGTIILEKVESKNGRLKVDASYTNGEWSGTVYDEEGEGLPGVNIVVAGTTAGTVSGVDGRFKVKADESKELYLTFVGYETVRLEGK